jgi:lysophospholipase L1-like esterase
MAKNPAASPLRFAPKQTIVFDGDSLTSRRMGPNRESWPLLTLNNWERTWADDVSRLLFAFRPDLALKFHECAIGGSSCRELAERFDRFVLPYKPDWVMMTMGGNDATREIPLTEFRERMTNYCQRVERECGGRVVFVSGFRPGPDHPNPDQHRKRYPYTKVLASVAREAGHHFLDIGPGFLRQAKLLYRQSTYHHFFSDGGHYNALGNLVLAGEVLRAFGVVCPVPGV